MKFFFPSRTHRTFPPGQGLLEALLAIGIIVLGLGALLTLTLKNISASTASRERIMATQLAREGVEVVRAMRDSNWLAASNGDPTRLWDKGLWNEAALGTCAADCNGAYISFNSTNPTYYVVGNWSPYALNFPNNQTIDQPDYALFRNVKYHFWTQFAGGTPPGSDYESTGYRRLVILDPVCKSGAGVVTVNQGQVDCGTDTKIGIQVTVEVDWPTAGLFGGALRRSLTLSEFLYNWR